MPDEQYGIDILSIPGLRLLVFKNHFPYCPPSDTILANI